MIKLIGMMDSPYVRRVAVSWNFMALRLKASRCPYSAHLRNFPGLTLR
jgi:hypothetical protein